MHDIQAKAFAQPLLMTVTIGEKPWTQLGSTYTADGFLACGKAPAAACEVRPHKAAMQREASGTTREIQGSGNGFIACTDVAEVKFIVRQIRTLCGASWWFEVPDTEFKSWRLVRWSRTGRTRVHLKAGRCC